MRERYARIDDTYTGDVEPRRESATVSTEGGGINRGFHPLPVDIPFVVLAKLRVISLAATGLR